ncbi:MAG: S9 family peptidase, partial [Planctomycetes bacterium]|nr:S9 family peptidase [Planctomycetota bacterium]
SEIHRLVGPDSWSLLTKIPPEDSLTTNPLGFDESRKNLYMLESRGRNTAALTLMNLESGKSTVLAEDPRADIQGFIAHPTKNLIQAVQSTYERRRWHVLDKSIARDLKVLEGVADGEFNITSRTKDDKFWTVAYVMDTGPVSYYLYDRDQKKAKFLFTNRSELEGVKLAKMHPKTIKSRDGLNLVCYYTLPVWSDPDNDGRPDKPQPMVLFVHGGPWARDNWGYNSNHQWLANRGYAVLSVNYRGSTGFGKDFINASNFEWAGKMHDDLLDAVAWAKKSGIADPNRIAIMGGSYGGYATLVGLTFTPDEFTCGVDIVGPSNLITLLNSIPPYWAPMIEIFAKRVGDHRTEEGKALLKRCSPLTRVDQIRKPLLIGQGANDPRVKQAESDQIVNAMKAKNIPVTYVLFPDEGHGFARPENRMAFNAVAEAFLSKHLGGRNEPIPEEMPGSSITVPTGGEGIPGLPKALIGLKKTPEGAS